MTSLFGRGYTKILALVGVTILLASAILSLPSIKRPEVLLLFVLAVSAGWLRVELEPFGQITLATIVLFTAATLIEPASLVFIASLSAFVSTTVFARNPLSVAAQETGERAISSLLAVLPLVNVPLLVNTPIGPIWFGRYALAISLYMVACLALAIIGAKQLEDVSPRAFLSEAGVLLVGNLAFFGLVAVAFAYFIRQYGILGYLILALATVTLMDSFHPYKLLSEQRRALYASLAMISQAIDLKDAYTGRHARDASEIAVRVARSVHLPEPEVRKIRIASILHDIGKVGVSRKIIRKPSALDSEEMKLMRRHPVIGAEIMQPVDLFADAAEIVRHHHEHYDGSGYPDGLQGEGIPIGSRIVLVADAFNAITTDRPYRKARSKDEALRILRGSSGKQFDPKIVAALETIVDHI